MKARKLWTEEYNSAAEKDGWYFQVFCYDRYGVPRYGIFCEDNGAMRDGPLPNPQTPYSIVATFLSGKGPDDIIQPHELAWLYATLATLPMELA